MKWIKRIAKFLLGLLLLLLVALPFCIRRVDRTPYASTDFYQRMMRQMDSIAKTPFALSDSSLLANWSKVNITPPMPLPTAGYGKREGKPYVAVHDSIFARVLVLQQGSTKVAMVSCDLLIIPPELTIQLKAMLPTINWQWSQVYVGATHTHNSIGAWGKRYIGELFAGTYSQSTVNLLAAKIVEGIEKASLQLQPANLHYHQFDAHELVKNRLVGDAGTEDPFFRYVLLTRDDQRKFALLSFAAHSTTLSDTVMQLSRDYPGALVDSIEQLNQVEEAMYFAGDVGSMGPEEKGENDWQQLQHHARQLQQKFTVAEKMWLPDAMDSARRPHLRLVSQPLHLREPQWRFASNWCFRHWLWSSLYGDYDCEVKSLRMNNVLLVGLPCDFSGELMASLEQYAAQKKLHLMVTSFNGGYAGYITKDEYYDKPGYETRVMNWFGPGNAAYFSEVVKRLIDLHSGD
jgi:neutral ceramidase